MVQDGSTASTGSEMYMSMENAGAAPFNVHSLPPPRAGHMRRPSDHSASGSRPGTAGDGERDREKGAVGGVRPSHS